ncbi:hypothetical protein [Polyangium jinanense]|uniref:Calcineurin-like phosphoesterase domain-containing protein n=1 Tax=Polyangium jinanense TaxID=2829994 RepID=A0A9X3X553_9BACT|nr:hypothetical protein [Polyangium jinanense]MDC3984474.1 hypothetical protein [Polyangium jinanense]
MSPNFPQVLEALGVLAALPASETDDMAKLLQQWKSYFETAPNVTVTPEQLSAWSTLLTNLIAAPDRPQELELIETACENPLLGLSLILASMPGTAKRQAQRWWNLHFAEQSSPERGSDGTPIVWKIKDGTTADWTVKTLPPPSPGSGPGTARKYLIFSDVHRDAATDDKGLFQSGSIDHFKRNAQLYQRILDYAITNGYTVIEGGDCEELWFIRSIQEYPRKSDGSLDIAAKLSEIVSTHPSIFERLRTLHKQGRYFRTYGNHDSYLRKAGTDDSVWQVLKTEMEKNNSGPFQLYDAFVIDGVKTMMEQGIADVLTDAAKLLVGQTTKEQLRDNLLIGRLGLDAGAYTEKCRMLVCHGHQFDPWNSANNQILGQLISNTVATYVDKKMDPFLDLRGFAWNGNPLLEFDDLFSRWPVFDSWPARSSAVRFAHQVQHMPNEQRVLLDNIMFYESVAALYGTFGIALNYWDPERNQEITPAQSRNELDLFSSSGIAEYLKRHHIHHICIGHTHNPHSQPHFKLDNIAALVPPLSRVIKTIQLETPDILEPQFKTTYFNSGTVGWMEGVVWAIEIDTTGQARLVYWTDKSTEPEYMDWELEVLPQEVKDLILQGATTALGATLPAIKTPVQTVYNALKERLAELNVSPGAMNQAIKKAAKLPVYSLALALMQSPEQLLRVRQLQEAPSALKRSVKQLQDQYERLRDFSLDVWFSVKRRFLSGFASDSETETCVIRAPIPEASRKNLERFKRILKTMNMTEDQALHYAGLALAIFDQLPRNLPFFSTVTEPQNPDARLHDSETPVLQALLGTLWMYPPAGQTVKIGGVVLQSKFALEGAHVSLTVTLSKDPGGVS